MEKWSNIFHVPPLWHHGQCSPQGMSVYTEPVSFKSIYGSHLVGTPSFSLRVRHTWVNGWGGIISGDA